MREPGHTSDRLAAVIVTQTEIASAGLDLGKVMDVIVHQAQALTQAGGAVVELADGDEMVYRAASGSAAASLGLRVLKAGSLSGWCVSLDKALNCPDALNDERVNNEVCERVGGRSMIVVPLRHINKVVGVLKVMSSEPNHFCELDMQTLQLISGLTGAALVNASQSETRQEEVDALFHKATHDPLTGLANRALFLDRLRHAVTLARREKSGVAVLLLDMDDLKTINETLGHPAGDAALKELSKRASSALRDTDTLARLGGDEFAAILSGVENHAGAAITIQRIHKLLELPFPFEEKSMDLRASIGAAVYPENGEDSATLMTAADFAMSKSRRVRRKQP